MAKFDTDCGGLKPIKALTTPPKKTTGTKKPATPKNTGKKK